MEDLWIPIVLVAAALQTARNAGQKHLSTRVSPWLAAWVRFGFGFPIALIYLVIVLAGFDLPFPPLTGKFLVPALVAALMQIAGTVFLIRLFRLRNFAIGSTFVRTEAIIAAVLGSVVFSESIDLWGWLAIVISVTGVVEERVVRPLEDRDLDVFSGRLQVTFELPSRIRGDKTVLLCEEPKDRRLERR